MSFALNWPRLSPGGPRFPLPSALAVALSRDPQLGRALLLALLLHLLLVLLVGNTPGGSAKPGEGVGGSLSVRLRGDEPSDPRPGPPRAAPPETPRQAQGPVGSARGERIGGQVRREDQARTLPPTPGAAREGRWNAETGQVLQGETSVPQLQRPEPLPAPSLEHLQTLPEAPSLPPQVLRQLVTPAAPSERPIAMPVAGLAPAASLSSEVLPPAPRAPRLPQLAPAPLARETLPATAMPSLSPLSPAELPALPEPVTRSLAAPAPLGRSEVLNPAESLTPISPAATAASAPELSPAPAVPSLPEPRLQQLPAPGTASSGLQHAAPPLAPLSSSSGASVQESNTALPKAPAAPALLPAVPPPPVIGAPDAGARLGQDVATPPSAAASAPPPKLNLSLPRGGEISGRESRGMLQLMPHPPERKNKLQQGIEDAARKDCREAYADKGLLAAVPLALGAASDKGCRW